MEETSKTPPASAGGEAETLVAAKEEDAAAAKAKRARKRSRYLSPPYTDSDAGADISPRREEQDEGGDEEVSLLLQLQEAKLAAADMLSALHGAALFDASPNRAHANVVDVDVLLRFFTLYRSKVLLLPPDDHHSSNANAAAGPGINNKKKTSSCSTASTININKDDDDASLSSSLVGHRLLNAVRAMADADGSACKNARAIKKEDDAMENAHHIGAVNAAAYAALEAGHKRKKMASASDGLNATTDFAVRATNGVADSAPNKKKKTRKRKAGHGQHFGDPAALVLDFTRGTALPSKEELLSSFRKFGFLIESETDIAKDTRRARVVFGTSAEAEAAYSCAETLGAFGPPFAARRLQYLSPIKLNAPQPPPSPSRARKLPLTDIRKNLEKMISSLTRPSSFRKDDGAKPAVHNHLVGEMQGLLAKVDKMLSAAGPSSSSSSTALHRH